ncbi:nuclear valosin-containing protein-like [Glandiceps talaboti]
MGKKKYKYRSSTPIKHVYIGDRQLFKRVELYIGSQETLTGISIDTMIQDLQRTYSEYNRRKKNVFRKSVEKVYDWICTNSGQKEENIDKLESSYLSKQLQKGSSDLESDSSSIDSDDDDEFSSDNLDYVDIPDINMVNNSLTNMYMGKIQPSGNYSNNSTPARTSAANTDNSDIEDDMQLPSNKQSKGKQNEDKTTLFFFDTLGERTSDKNSVCENVKTPQRTENVTNVSLNDSLLSESRTVRSMDKDSLQSKDTPSTPAHRENRKSENEEQKSGETSQKKKRKLNSVQGSSKESDNKRKKLVTEGRKQTKKGVELKTSTIRFSDIGGNDANLKEVCKLLVHMRHPEIYQQLGVTPPRGILLHGPPGCGKTLLAHAIAGELDLPFLKIAATEIVSGVSGESEENIRDLFDKAEISAPCIVFIDEIDAITPKRETAQKEMERRIVAQLLTCMDELSTSTAQVLVIGATNRADSLEPALRRAGRFDREISLGIPDEQARKRILQVMCKKLKLSEDFNFQYLASQTPGYVGADLMSLCREAAMCAVNRVFHDLQITNPPQQPTTAACSSDSVTMEESDNMDTIPPPAELLTLESGGTQLSTLENELPPSEEPKQLTSEEPQNSLPETSCLSSQKSHLLSEKSQQSIPQEGYESVLNWLRDQPPLTEEQLKDLSIGIQDFEIALPLVQPSAKREGFATIPDVTWNDIGALEDVREELTMAILAPVRNPDAFKALGLTNPPGILLAGPPGCGKTLLAKAIANESGINFISVKGPELLNMYVGESERAVRQCFQRARNSAPCVIFFDELDALCPRRSNVTESGSSARVVNQLLTEMDGLEARKQVFIMGATNRPDIIDPAVLRPGRLDKILYVGIPSQQDRIKILQTITKNGTKPKLSTDVDIESIGNDERCDGFTGADLSALVREAAMAALKTIISTSPPTSADSDLSQSQPSTTIIQVSKDNIEVAFTKVKASVSKKDQQMYGKMGLSRAIL